MIGLKIATFAILVVSLLAATKTVSIICQGCSSQMNCIANYKCLSYSSTGVTTFESCYTGTSCGSFTTAISVTVSNCTYDYKSASCSSKVCAYYPGLIIPTSTAVGSCTATAANA